MSEHLPPTAVKLAEGLCDDEIQVWSVRYERTLGRQPLLQLLAGYLGTSWESVVLADSAHGRPELDGEHRDRVCFNWSHSGTRAVVAVARSVQPGIDLEHVQRRAGRDVMALAQRFFAPAEAAALGALPADARGRAFLRLWTVKEAVLKAHGRGLAYGLHRVQVSLHGEAAGTRVQLEDGDADAWQVRELALDPGWIAAVAWRGASMRVRWCGEIR